jgi:GNAT superfamily N-acetyltransferase
MMTETDKLDNPAWYSLSETHSKFAIDYDDVKFYQPDYCPFGGAPGLKNNEAAIEKYAALAADFFVIGEKPLIPRHVIIRKELVCLQMIIDDLIVVKQIENIVKLDQGHLHVLSQLVNLVQPGYFKMKTALLGEYFGIFKNGVLVAVTGERMKMNGFTEVSAIVTHPDHTGKGYAKQLIAHCVNNIFLKGSVPYLHVVESNSLAINIYLKSGFRTRRKISFWNVVKQ